MIQEFLSFLGSETCTVIIHFPAWFWFHIHTGPTRAVDKTPPWLRNAMSASFATTYPVTQKGALNVYINVLSVDLRVILISHLNPSPTISYYFSRMLWFRLTSHVSRRCRCRSQHCWWQGRGTRALAKSWGDWKERKVMCNFRHEATKYYEPFSLSVYVGVWMCNVDHAQLYIMVQVLHEIFSEGCIIRFDKGTMTSQIAWNAGTIYCNQVL